MSAGSHARALANHQRGMAIQILTGCPDAVTFHDIGPDGVTITAPRLLRMDRGIPEHAILAMLDGRGTFDVARVRAYARELIALELERVAFVDWCMDQGMGPDNRESCAFVGGCEWCEDGDGQPGSYALVSGAMPQDEPSAVLGPDGRWRWRVECDRCNGARGGWPGRFAKAWGTVQCGACKGRRGAMVPDCKNAAYNGLGCRTPGSLAAMENPPVIEGAWHSSQCFDTWVWCTRCDGTGRTPKHGADRRAPMGRSLARMGRRLIDALDKPVPCEWCTNGLCDFGNGDVRDCPECGGDGHCRQSSACWHPRCVNGEQVWWDGATNHCDPCNGTGHNLRGMLPPVEITQAMMSSLTDEWLSTRFSDFPQWTEACRITRFDVETWSLSHLTRVVDRGEHIHRGVRDPDHDLDRRISERLWDVWGDDWHEVPLPPGVHGPRKRVRKRPEPSWRRGLRVHAQQRRDRSAE